MEVKLLLSETSQESISNKPWSSWIGIISRKRRQCFSCYHNRHSFSLQLLLSQHYSHLRMINIRSFRACYSHHTEIIVGKLFLKAWQAIVNNFGWFGIQVMFVLSIQVIQGILFIDYFILKISHDFFRFLHMNSSVALYLVSLLIAGKVLSSHVIDILRGWLFIGIANLCYCLFVENFQLFFSFLIHLFLKDEII